VVKFTGRTGWQGWVALRTVALGILFLHFYYLSHLFYYKLTITTDLFRIKEKSSTANLQNDIEVMISSSVVWAINSISRPYSIFCITYANNKYWQNINKDQKRIISIHFIHTTITTAEWTYSPASPSRSSPCPPKSSSSHCLYASHVDSTPASTDQCANSLSCKIYSATRTSGNCTVRTFHATFTDPLTPSAALSQWLLSFKAFATVIQADPIVTCCLIRKDATFSLSKLSLKPGSCVATLLTSRNCPKYRAYATPHTLSADGTTAWMSLLAFITVNYHKIQNYANLVVESPNDVNMLFGQYLSSTFSLNFSSLLSRYSHVLAMPFSVYPQPYSIVATILKSL
jgi:hypothetical protein